MEKVDIEIYEWVWVCPKCPGYEPNFVLNSELWGDDASTKPQKCSECGTEVNPVRPR